MVKMVLVRVVEVKVVVVLTYVAFYIGLFHMKYV